LSSRRHTDTHTHRMTQLSSRRHTDTHTQDDYWTPPPFLPHTWARVNNKKVTRCMDNRTAKVGRQVGMVADK